jgi:hypothetical protein
VGFVRARKMNAVPVVTPSVLHQIQKQGVGQIILRIYLPQLLPLGQVTSGIGGSFLFLRNENVLRELQKDDCVNKKTCYAKRLRLYSPILLLYEPES